MILDGEFLVITPEEARTLPDHELREAFVAIVNELYADFGAHGSLGDALPFLREGPLDFDTISTERMRRIALEQQYWFNPLPDAKGVPNAEGGPRIVGDLAPDIADDPAQPGAQEFQCPPHPLLPAPRHVHGHK